MALLIDGRELINIPSDINVILDENPDLKFRSQLYIDSLKLSLKNESNTQQTFNNSNFNVYVNQREYVIIDPTQSWLKFVGSDEATTCHIVFLQLKSSIISSPRRLPFSLIHIDSEIGIEDWLMNSIIKIIKHSKMQIIQKTDSVTHVNKDIDLSLYMFDVLVFSGYQDEQGVSAKITRALLDALNTFYHPHYIIQYNLVCLCTGTLNTQYINPSDTLLGKTHKSESNKSQTIALPIITGIAYNLKEDTFITSNNYNYNNIYKHNCNNCSGISNPIHIDKQQLNPFPAHFVSKGPEALLRAARNFVSFQDCVNSANKIKKHGENDDCGDINCSSYSNTTSLDKITNDNKNKNRYDSRYIDIMPYTMHPKSPALITKLSKFKVNSNTDILYFHFHLCKLYNGEAIAQLSNADLLLNFSTSPYAESPHFAPRLKKVFTMLQIKPGNQTTALTSSHDSYPNANKSNSSQEEIIDKDILYQLNIETGAWEAK